MDLGDKNNLANDTHPGLHGEARARHASTVGLENVKAEEVPGDV